MAARPGRQLLRRRHRAIMHSMESSFRRKKFWARLGIVLGIWTGLAAVLTGQGYLIVYTRFRPMRTSAITGPAWP